MNKQNTSQRNFDDSYTPELESIKAAFVSQKQRAYACATRGIAATPELCQYWESEFDRAIAAHDTELREQIAQEIEVHMRRHDNAQIGFSAVGDAYAHAARIARGETGEVKRCLQCGCDLRYPTAVHIVDCGPRKEQD